MGVDINGLNPQIIGERPKQPDWNTASDHEKDLYFNALGVWEDQNPGVYFRSNWWGWRPIHTIADMAIYITQLPFDTDSWAENGSGGLKTQEECTLLADAMDTFMILNKANMHDDDDRVYTCLGSWCTADGRFLSDEVVDKLNQDYPIGTIFYQGVVAADGTLAFPSHSAPLYHIKNFVTFLRHCGGFEIW